MNNLLSSIHASPSFRLSSVDAKNPNESGIITTSYSIFGMFLSWLAKTSAFQNWSFAKDELKHNICVNAAFIKAIHDGLGEYEANMARCWLGLDSQQDRVIDGLTAHAVLTCLGADKQQFALEGQTSSKIKDSTASLAAPEMQRTTLKTIASTEMQTDTGLADTQTSVAEVCSLLTRKIADTDVLLLRETLMGSVLYFENADKVNATQALKNRAESAALYLNKCPKFKPYLKSPPQNNQPQPINVTAAYLRHISQSAYTAELELVYHKLGQSKNSRHEIRRTPTEVTMHWISVLQEAMIKESVPSIQSLIGALLKAQQRRWMEHNLTLKATKNSLQQDSNLLRSVGRPDLANIAAARSANDLSPSLHHQLPATEQGLHTTRLHDNIYGRVFESHWVANLVESPPQAVMETMHKISVGMAGMVHEIPENEKEYFVKFLQNKVINDSRFWFNQEKDIRDFSSSTWPQSYEVLQKILTTPVKSGLKTIATPYLMIKIFLSLNRQTSEVSSNHWMNITNKNYAKTVETQSNKNITGEGRVYTPSAGITMGHQPVAIRKEWMTATQRPALRHAYKSINTSIENSLKHGIPYVSGVSGSTNIMLGIISHLRDNGKEIDPKTALLGTAMFLNYDGGHSIHEALWVANQRDPELNFHLRSSPRPREENPKDFISNYESFQNIFSEKECFHALESSLSKAWNETIKYFRKNSYFAKK